jgi:hypothetical protein
MSINHLLAFNDQYSGILNPEFNSLKVRSSIISNNLFLTGTIQNGGGIGTLEIGQRSMYIASVGPTGIVRQSGGILGIVHTNGTGIYILTFNSGLFLPLVQATPESNGAKFIAISNLTTSSVQISTFDNAGVASDVGFHIVIYLL